MSVVQQIKNTFANHIKQQRTRRKILWNLWEKEEQALHFKNYPKHTQKYNAHQELLEATKRDFWDTAKAAILEKFVTFCKNSYLDQVM